MARLIQKHVSALQRTFSKSSVAETELESIWWDYTPAKLRENPEILIKCVSPSNPHLVIYVQHQCPAPMPELECPLHSKVRSASKSSRKWECNIYCGWTTNNVAIGLLIQKCNWLSILNVSTEVQTKRNPEFLLNAMLISWYIDEERVRKSAKQD